MTAQLRNKSKPRTISAAAVDRPANDPHHEQYHRPKKQWGRRPGAASGKARGPHPRTVMCRGCEQMCPVLFPICEGCLAQLPTELRVLVEETHARYDVGARIAAQNVARSFFHARDGGRIFTPTMAQPTVFTEEGNRAWID